MMLQISTKTVFQITVCALLAACSLTPSGFDAELKRSDLIGVHYSKLYEQRKIVELPVTPSWKDILQRALLVNGDLEASYFQWQASLAKVSSVSAYPNTNTMIGYSYLFSKSTMKSFDRSSFDIGFDTMQNLSFPSKVIKAGDVAFEDAQSKGQAVTVKKFEIQKEVLSQWATYEALAVKFRIAQEKASLFKLLENSSLAGITGGESQKEAIQVCLKSEEIQNQVAEFNAKLEAARAKLRGLLALDSKTQINLPKVIENRPLKVDDATLINASVSSNPEIASIAHDIEGKRNALELARLQWIPDINPTAMFTGAIEKTLGVSILLPTAIAKIEGEIDEAKASLQSNIAQFRQTKLNKTASFISTLVLLRDLERQIKLYEKTLLPLAKLLINSAEANYSTGIIKVSDLIDANMTFLNLKEMLVDLQTEREKTLAELEEVMGADIEAIQYKTSQEPKRI